MNKMHIRNFYIIRLFLILLSVFLLLLTATGIGIYAYARKSVGEEFLRLNQATLTQLADAMGETLSNVIRYGEKVSVSNRILTLGRRTDTGAEIHNVLTALQSEFNEFHTSGLGRLETYVAFKNGLTAASVSASETFNWQQLTGDARLEPLFQGETDMMLLPSVWNEDQTGIMRNTFQLVFAMRDLLTGEGKGCVVLDVSELLLFEQYRSYLKDDTELCIISPEGEVLSHKSKQLIGTQYGLDQTGLEQTRQKDGRLIFHARIRGTTWLLVETIPEQTAFGTLTSLRNMVLGAVLVTTVVFIAAMVLVSRSILLRVMRLRDKMGQVIEGDLTVRIPESRNDEFGQIECDFNTMVSRIDQLIAQTRESEHQKRIAEMDFLHAQINSHFIHNTLTSIRFMLEMGKTEQAGEMIFYFSKLLRKTLSRSAEFIPLSEELDTLKSYVALQQYRYPDTFAVAYQIAPDTEAAMLPALILQPVVENAVFYGVGHALTHITIRAWREGKDLILEVADDGVGMSREKQASVLQKGASLNHVGLRNVHDRIQLNYGQEYGLKIQSKPGAGTVITFLLPYLDS